MNEGHEASKSKQIALVDESVPESSGVVKSPNIQNKFDTLLDMVSEEGSDDSSIKKEYVEATQLIEDESDSIENSPMDNINKNQEFLQIIGLLLLTWKVRRIRIIWEWKSLPKNHQVSLLWEVKIGRKRLSLEVDI